MLKNPVKKTQSQPHIYIVKNTIYQKKIIHPPPETSNGILLHALIETSVIK